MSLTCQNVLVVQNNIVHTNNTKDMDTINRKTNLKTKLSCPKGRFAHTHTHTHKTNFSTWTTTVLVKIKKMTLRILPRISQ